ncbi:FAD-dependent oxidoreductase [Mesorhizobium sp. M0816]|uniref:FAD-dependent oxidoreductase n=1 Tax=Mesorhizobium sp. M0816 TaxID=2957006 RepID=UPI00333CAF8C
MRDVIVLGAGVVGMTSAYALARKGFAVTVIDAASAPAEGGASFGNGAQLSYSYTDAMASPSMVVNLPKYLLGCDPALRIALTPSPRFMSWGLRFLANATRSSFERNTIEVLKLAMESRTGFAELSERIEFDYRSTGKLNVYSSHESLRNAEALSVLKNHYGAGQVILTRDQAIARDPALAHYGHPFVGALWSPFDAAGDSSLFCRNLRSLLENDYGVRFMLQTKVERLGTRAGIIAAVGTAVGELSCTRAVIALGAWTAPIARTVGISLPIWPVQGYSLTIPATALAPVASITDTARKMVFCRIGDRLRIAGLADIGPSSGEFKQERFRTLLDTAKGIFPKAGDYDGEVNAWTGLRPMTPNSQPIVGSSKVGGLFLNCGHGSLGWTLSMATASRLAEVVSASA